MSEPTVGSRFGSWTVIAPPFVDAQGEKCVPCRCQCGNERQVLERILRNGDSLSCGCVSEGRGRIANISGRVFDRLTALYPTNERTPGGSVVWRCRCQCGSETDVSYNELMYTNVKSCGCMKREHEASLYTSIERASGTSMDMLRSEKLPSNNKTGTRGVYLIRGRWVAKIVFQKKQYYLGSYDDIEEAVRVRRSAEEMLFKETVRHYDAWKARAEKDSRWAEANPFQIIVQRSGDGEPTVSFLPIW